MKHKSVILCWRYDDYITFKDVTDKDLDYIIEQLDAEELIEMRQSK